MVIIFQPASLNCQRVWKLLTAQSLFLDEAPIIELTNVMWRDDELNGSPPIAVLGSAARLGRHSSADRATRDCVSSNDETRISRKPYLRIEGRSPPSDGGGAESGRLLL